MYKRQDNPFLSALAKRENPLRNGRQTTILFIRDVKYGADGKIKDEVSAYIDLADRMKKENFGPIFNKKKTLVPKKTDLSWYSWTSGKTAFNVTSNFKVDAQSDQGLLFRNKRDRKVIDVNPERESPGDGTLREVVECDEYE